MKLKTSLIALTLTLPLIGAPALAQEDPSPQPRIDREALRDVPTPELIAALGDLGPTPERRLAPTHVAPEELRKMLEAAQSWGHRNIRTNEDGARKRARREQVRRLGLRAVPLVVASLEDDSYWIRREAALACAQLVERYGDQARWILIHHDVPQLLIELIGTGPEVERVGLREELELTLAAIVEEDPTLALDLRERTWWLPRERDERDALVARLWRKTWATFKVRWDRVQELRAARRRAIQAELRVRLAESVLEGHAVRRLADGIQTTR